MHVAAASLVGATMLAIGASVDDIGTAVAAVGAFGAAALMFKMNARQTSVLMSAQTELVTTLQATVTKLTQENGEQRDQLNELTQQLADLALVKQIASHPTPPAEQEQGT